MKPIVIAAGGTGGHLYPAEALADRLMARSHRIVLMTDRRSGALDSPVFAACERHVLAGAGVSGRGIGRAASGFAQLVKGTRAARRLLAGIEPAAVVGFGGYPSVPPVLAARRLRTRPVILLHEQNAVLGRANRFLARFAEHLALSLEPTERLPAGMARTLTGNPVREAVTALAGAPYVPPAGRISLLVLGGSLGAKIFATLIPQALALLAGDLRARIDLAIQAPEGELPGLRERLAAIGVSHVAARFFGDVADRLAGAHLVVARAGASTVAEIAVAGRPAIFIPLPHAIDDHQRANADALARHGAALRLDQAVTTPDALAGAIFRLLAEPARLATMAEAAAAAGRPRAAADLADLIETLASDRLQTLETTPLETIHPETIPPETGS